MQHLLCNSSVDWGVVEIAVNFGMEYSQAIYMKLWSTAVDVLTVLRKCGVYCQSLETEEYTEGCNVVSPQELVISESCC